MRTNNLLLALLLVVAVPALAQTPRNTGKKLSSCLTKAPEMSFAFDTTNLKGRGLADNYFLWDNGKELHVRFLSGSPAMQNRIIAAAKEWEKHANIKFTFVKTGPAHIRILLTDGDGYWSMVGQQSSMIPQDEPTMSFDTTGGHFRNPVSLRGTVLHEFGHAIGLLHEHSSPISGIDWDKEAVYRDFEGVWDRYTVDAQIFETYKVSYTNGTRYDNKSIMHYPINPKHTRNNYRVDWNWEISAGDKELVSLLYPKGTTTRANEVARFTVSDYTRMEVVNGVDKLSMYPSFVLNTAGKSGTVYFIVMLYDENGMPILDNDDKYNISGVVGAYDAGVYQPGKRLGANKNGRDFELSIPYSQIPVAAGTKILAVFRAYLFNDQQELKLLYSSEPVMFSLKKSNK